MEQYRWSAVGACLPKIDVSISPGKVMQRARAKPHDPNSSKPFPSSPLHRKQFDMKLQGSGHSGVPQTDLSNDGLIF